MGLNVHNVWTHEVTIQSSAKIQMSFRTLLVNMYSEAIVLQVSISHVLYYSALVLLSTVISDSMFL